MTYRQVETPNFKTFSVPHFDDMLPGFVPEAILPHGVFEQTISKYRQRHDKKQLSECCSDSPGPL